MAVTMPSGEDWRMDAIRAGDKESMIRYAEDPECPEEVLRRLAESGYQAVRGASACNPSLPLDALIGLADDRVLGVQLAVADNPICPVEVAEKIRARVKAQQAHQREKLSRQQAEQDDGELPF